MKILLLMDTSDVFFTLTAHPGGLHRARPLEGGGKKAAGYPRMTERTATKPGYESRRSPAVRQKQEGLKQRLLGPYALQQRFSLD